MTREDLLDYVNRAAVLGCGGGGTDWGIGIINDAIESGHVFKLTKISEFDSDVVLYILTGVDEGVLDEVREKRPPCQKLGCVC